MLAVAETQYPRQAALRPAAALTPGSWRKHTMTLYTASQGSIASAPASAGTVGFEGNAARVGGSSVGASGGFSGKEGTPVIASAGSVGVEVMSDKETERAIIAAEVVSDVRRRTEALAQIKEINGLAVKGGGGDESISGARVESVVRTVNQETQASDRVAVKMRAAGNDSRDVFVIAYTAMPSTCFVQGPQIVWKRGVAGAYLSYRSSWNTVFYGSSMDVSKAEGGFLATGNISSACSLAVAGAVVSILPDWEDLYAGASVGSRSVFWEKYNTQNSSSWVKVENLSARGLSLEAGMMVSIPLTRSFGMTLGVGCASIAFTVPSLVLSAGVFF